MAAEPVNQTLMLLRDIRAKQDEHSEKLSAIETRLGGLETRAEDTRHEITYALGMIANADRKAQQALHSSQDIARRMDEVIARLEAVETR